MTLNLDESARIIAFRGFRAELRIIDEYGEPLAVMTITGNAAIVSETIKWTADAFREDQER